MRRFERSAALFFLAVFAWSSGAVSAEVARLRAQVVAEHSHDPTSYTQGLLWHDGWLYESVGNYGKSAIMQLDLASGKSLRRVDLPAELFGEGLARVEQRLVQITWQEQVARVYDLESLELLETYTYEGQGWGLCYDGKRLVMSDGSNRLTFRDPSTFESLGSVWVTFANRPFSQLNELECVDGKVYANVYGREELVRIDPATGAVDQVIDASGMLSPLFRNRVDVLNGIAYRPDAKTFLLTGKYWPVMFEVTFEPVSAATTD